MDGVLTSPSHEAHVVPNNLTSSVAEIVTMSENRIFIFYYNNSILIYIDQLHIKQYDAGELYKLQYYMG